MTQWDSTDSGNHPIQAAAAAVEGEDERQHLLAHPRRQPRR